MSKFAEDGIEGNQTSAFIQWKGTDVCMDFYCECGEHCHFDGDFAYTVKCPVCHTIWEMPCIVFPRKASDKTYEYWRNNPKLMERDNEGGDAP